MRKLVVILIIFLGLLLISCSDPTSSPVPIPLPPDETVGITDKAFLHLNILEGKIFNTSADMEYTIIGDWSDTLESEGAIQPLDLNIGSHVIVRGISNPTWERDLGTVEALSGLPDFMPGKALYIGTGYFNDLIYDSRLNGGKIFPFQLHLIHRPSAKKDINKANEKIQILR